MEAQAPESPYAPPRAVVDDVQDSRQPPPERPPQVGRVMKCLWASWCIGLAWSIYSFFFPAQVTPAGPAATFGFFAVGALFSAWLYGRLSKGRNWARVLMLIFGVFSLIAIPLVFMQVRAGTLKPAGLGVSAITYSLHFYVYYLLLTRPVREWYYAMKGRG